MIPKNGNRFSEKIRLMFQNTSLSPRQILDDIALCLVFFTRLPLPVFDFRGRGLAAAIWAAPVAGLAIGLIGAIVYATAERFGLAMGPAAALALAATLTTTGCLHEDGLADLADSFGGHTRERKLEIMHDSRIGVFGASALTLSLLLRCAALASIPDPMLAAFALLAAHTAARATLPAWRSTQACTFMSAGR